MRIRFFSFLSLSQHGIRAKGENLIFFFGLAVYSISANRPVTVFHSGPLILFPNHSEQPHRRRISITPATFSGDIFRRPFFRETTTYSEPPEADLHASGNPTGNRHLTRPHAPPFSSGLSPTRRRVTARGPLSGHFRHLSRLVRRRLGLLALRQSSPSPASPFFSLFLAFLPFRPPPTGLPPISAAWVLLLFLSRALFDPNT